MYDKHLIKLFIYTWPMYGGLACVILEDKGIKFISLTGIWKSNIYFYFNKERRKKQVKSNRNNSFSVNFKYRILFELKMLIQQICAFHSE